MMQLTISGDAATLSKILSLLDGATAEAAPAAKPGRKPKAAAAAPAEPEPEPESSIDIEDLRKQVQDAVDTFGGAKVRELFKKHGATKLKDLKPSKFEAMNADLEALATADYDLA